MKPARVFFLPAIEGGCSCGSACGSGARTDNRKAESLVRTLARDLGDAVEVTFADYSTRGGLASAAAALDLGVQRPGLKVSEGTLPAVLAAAGPFILLNGKVVANGVLPSLDELKRIIGRGDSADHRDVAEGRAGGRALRRPE